MARAATRRLRHRDSVGVDIVIGGSVAAIWLRDWLTAWNRCLANPRPSSPWLVARHH
jgi:hypothetical protein